MLQSFVVYTELAISLFLLGLVSAKRERVYHYENKKLWFWYWEVVLALFVFAFVSGIRFQVGVDHFAYLKNYLMLQNSNVFLFEKEFGFDAITSLFVSLGFHFSFYFGFFAFLQIFFIYRAFKNERYLYPFLGVVIIFGPHYLSWMNGIRQMLVATIFVYSIQFIVQKNFLKYTATIFLASLIHQSALILLPLYFLPQRDYFKSRGVLVFLVFITIYIGTTNVWIGLLNSLGGLISFIGYDNISGKLDLLIENNQVRNIGPRNLSIIFLALVTIWFSPQLKRRFEYTNFSIYFNFSILGVLFSNLLNNAHHIFLRPITYLTVFSIVTTAYLLAYLAKKNILWFFVVLMLVLSYLPMTLVAESKNIYQDYSNYKFFWDYGY
ncbi:EpsG family protein [Marinobacterium rhizophilum]|uniref:EpsG family protein n=1 Tax=Marinobacterium rhizophilum TaxID=420402 RepID=A0ABY5HFK5_9GAMM|nr:EpsG family protein [Marinobacterium rhizophilum]UTW10631.1 EpsG family protein [Marinobacterium rhizophilum]